MAAVEALPFLEMVGQAVLTVLRPVAENMAVAGARQKMIAPPSQDCLVEMVQLE